MIIELLKKKDRITKKKALEWFECSNKITIVLWNQVFDCLVEYITPFLLRYDFEKRYVISDENYKDAITPEIFCDIENETLYVAIFSTGAYQEIIFGIGGVYHCLISEGKEFIIYENKKRCFRIILTI